MCSWAQVQLTAPRNSANIADLIGNRVFEVENHGYPRKAEQVGRDNGARRAPLSRLKLVPKIIMWCGKATTHNDFR